MNGPTPSKQMNGPTPSKKMNGPTPWVEIGGCWGQAKPRPKQQLGGDAAGRWVGQDTPDLTLFDLDGGGGTFRSASFLSTANENMQLQIWTLAHNIWQRNMRKLVVWK